MKKLVRRLYRTGDFWGGLAAMLVALPAAIAFGVTIYSAIGPGYSALGAVAGIVGATVIGLVASTLGGTDRLISAPCAPAAAVLSAFAIELVRQGVAPSAIVLLLPLLGILAGLIQVLFGFVGIGRLIKYVPYPVVSGYLSAVGLIILGSQLQKLVGAPTGTSWSQAAISPWLWDWRSVTVGLCTIVAMVAAPRLTQRLPGTILGILAGGTAYFALAFQDDSLLSLAGNSLVVGPLGAQEGDYLAAIRDRWHDIGDLRLGQIAGLLGSALTLAALLSIDTLKTCVVLDQMTRSRHDSNRELVAQGIANVASSTLGGIPGAGTMGASLVNLSSGANTRASGLVEGVAALAAALILGAFIAWIPVAALAGILMVVGFRMLDKEPLRFVESSATVLDFGVVVAVVVVALTVGLIAASAVGVGLAIILFLREQIGGSVVRHKFYANQISSSWYRPEADVRVLEQKGDQAVIFELQGSLFFGTTQQLYGEMEPELKTRSFVVLDLKRVQSVDVTAAHLLQQVRDTLRQRGAMLLLSGVREQLPNGRNLREFLDQVGVTGDEEAVRVFPERDNAIEWVEDRLLGEREGEPSQPETPLQLQEMELFKSRKDETLVDLERCMQQRTYAPGETIYTRGEAGDTLFLIRRGAVRIFVPIGAGRTRHIASFGRGDFFGGLSFLDGSPRGNDAIASVETEVYILSLERFNQLADDHKRLAYNLMTAIARTLARRLRYADQEVTMLQEY